MTKLLIGADTETHPIHANNCYPAVVCVTWATEDGKSFLVGNDDPAAQETYFAQLLSPGTFLVFHNAAYDLMCMAITYPSLVPLIFRKLDAGEVKCTMVREKLLNLTDHGELKVRILPHGATERFDYKLATLLMAYLNIDISGSKAGDDVWRVRYHELSGVPGDQYPKEAREYAISDAEYCLPLYRAQEERASKLLKEGIDSFITEDFRVRTHFCLSFLTMAGDHIDPVKVKEIQDLMEEELSPERVDLLVSSGILSPAVEGKPFKNGSRDHQPDCRGHKEHPNYSKKAVKDCECPLKMSKPKKEKINKKVLQEYVERLAETDSRVKVKRTDPSSKFPEGQTKVDSDWLQDFSGYDPVPEGRDESILGQYQHRAELQKIVTSYLNKLVDEEGNIVPKIHANFDPLKETGRTSSFGGNLTFSWNGQQVDPRIRPAVVPRPPTEDGTPYYKLSADYRAMELGTLAQSCLNRFGRSELAKVINAGEDAHGFLGARLAYEMDPTFKDWYHQNEKFMDQWALYHLFTGFKGHEVEYWSKFYKKFRTLAKPVGLGFPGGLGPAKMREIGIAQYRIDPQDLTLDIAKQCREFWKSVFPEMVLHLEYPETACKDLRNSPRTFRKKDGSLDSEDCYRYVTPMNLVRSGCTFCACTNGTGLQSPSAEGALTGFNKIVEECYNLSKGSVLINGAFVPTNFIHDEIFGDIRGDEGMMDCVNRIDQLMVEGMMTITPDVKAYTEICIAERWYKQADPVYNEDGVLVPWRPKEEA